MQEHDYLPPGAPGLNSRIINELEQAEDSEEEDDRLETGFLVLKFLVFFLMRNFQSFCVCVFNLRSYHLRPRPTVLTHNRDIEKGQPTKFSI
jgi:hypothetical protein